MNNSEGGVTTVIRSDNIRSDNICLPQKALHIRSPTFLEMAEHLPACQWEVMKEFLILLCLCAALLL